MASTCVSGDTLPAPSLKTKHVGLLPPSPLPPPAPRRSTLQPAIATPSSLHPLSQQHPLALLPPVAVEDGCSLQCRSLHICSTQPPTAKHLPAGPQSLPLRPPLLLTAARPGTPLTACQLWPHQHPPAAASPTQASARAACWTVVGHAAQRWTGKVGGVVVMGVWVRGSSNSGEDRKRDIREKEGEAAPFLSTPPLSLVPCCVRRIPTHTPTQHLPVRVP